MDKIGSNKAVIDQINESMKVPKKISQVKYPNIIIEQDHRAAKRVAKPMLRFKSFNRAQSVLAAIELMHMFAKVSRIFLVQKRCLLPTNFMLWQVKFVQFENQYQLCQNFYLEVLHDQTLFCEVKLTFN